MTTTPIMTENQRNAVEGLLSVIVANDDHMTRLMLLNALRELLAPHMGWTTAFHMTNAFREALYAARKMNTLTE